MIERGGDMSEPQLPRPKDATTVREPETESYDPKTSASMKLEADTEKDLTAILVPEVQASPVAPLTVSVEQAKPSVEAPDPVRNGEFATLFQGTETQVELKVRLQSIGAPDFDSLGVTVKPVTDGYLGTSAAFVFPHATQVRGEFGVKTDFSKSPDEAPRYKGEKIQSITVTAASAENPDGATTIQTERGPSHSVRLKDANLRFHQCSLSLMPKEMPPRFWQTVTKQSFKVTAFKSLNSVYSMRKVGSSSVNSIPPMVRRPSHISKMVAGNWTSIRPGLMARLRS